ncbi:hypothetical protein LR48_Vigan424s000300 [Vigna angularis]|uniref:Uncharacterized protein n=1 Tax=Phaseolus angularis TaxID=3914 RepID=A0A0L9TAT0_PHAAN|nr:hypothetical protein LR48_Vigan424s000300 [Vigna angularis]
MVLRLILSARTLSRKLASEINEALLAQSREVKPSQNRAVNPARKGGKALSKPNGKARSLGSTPRSKQRGKAISKTEREVKPSQSRTVKLVHKEALLGQNRRPRGKSLSVHVEGRAVKPSRLMSKDERTSGKSLSVNVEGREVIADEISVCANTSNNKAPLGHPSLITHLCKLAGVDTSAPPFKRPRKAIDEAYYRQNCGGAQLQSIHRGQVATAEMIVGMYDTPPAHRWTMDEFHNVVAWPEEGAHGAGAEAAEASVREMEEDEADDDDAIEDDEDEEEEEDTKDNSD